MGAGHFLRSLFDETESKAKEAQDKFNKERQADIDMYRKVMLDPNASPEQRDKAAKEIEKLRNIKGKDGPFSKLSGILNLVKGHHGKMQAPPASQNQEETPSAGGGGMPSSGDRNAGSGGIAYGEKPQMAPPPSSVGSAKQNVAQRALDKVGKGLGVATGIIDRAMTGQSKSQSLPQMDSSVFTPQNPMTEYRKQLKEAVPGISDEQLDKAVETKFGAVAKQTNYSKKSTVKGSDISGVDADIFGNPIDKAKSYDLLQNTAGDREYIPSTPKPGGYSRKSTVAGSSIPETEQDAFGKPIVKNAPYDVLENSAGERQYFPSIGKPDVDVSGVTQQWVYDPVKNEFKLMPIAHSSHRHQSYPGMNPPPSGDSSKNGQGATSGSGGKGGMKPPPGSQKPPTGQPSAGKGQSTVVPIRAFGPLQKQSNAINEARNSLIGDTPGQVGGIAKDIDIFKNPASVKRVGDYIKYVNQQLEEQAKVGTGSGAMAAAEWYVGLPSFISNLQSEALRNYSKTLDGGAQDGPEHQFVADYYRWLGTWGAMRAATGASAARWSFRTLISEGVTPGPVTTYPEALQRIKNMAKESNVVAQNNPMVQKIDVDGLFGGSKGSKLPEKDQQLLKKYGLPVN